jgi:hypothetical protein
MTRHADNSSLCELSDEDLERHLMGHVPDKAELTQMEEHLIGCWACAKRSEALADYIAMMRDALGQIERKVGGSSHQ